MQHPDTNTYYVVCTPLAPGLPTISGTLEFAGTHLTTEGHEIRFRGNTPLTEEPAAPAPWHRTWNRWDDVPPGVIVNGSAERANWEFQKAPDGTPLRRGRFNREWTTCSVPRTHAPFTRTTGVRR